MESYKMAVGGVSTGRQHWRLRLHSFEKVRTSQRPQVQTDIAKVTSENWNIFTVHHPWQMKSLYQTKW